MELGSTRAMEGLAAEQARCKQYISAPTLGPVARPQWEVGTTTDDVFIASSEVELGR